MAENGASQGPAELVHSQRGLVRVIKDVASGELVVADELEQTPVKLVGPGLADERDFSARAGTALGRVVVRFDQEL